MALAPLAHVLFTRVMRYDPSDPDWPDRDRFVLSYGHASILLYSMLYLTGYGLTLEDLEPFRQLGQPHPGPPRGPPHRRASRSPPARSARASPTASAWASPSGWLRAHFGPEPGRPPHLRDRRRRLPRGGHLPRGGLARRPPRLGRLVYVYDDNHITIDGPTELTLNDDAGRAVRAPTAGTSRTSARWPTTSTPSRRRCGGPWPSRTGPSLIVLRSHIG